MAVPLGTAEQREVVKALLYAAAADVAAIDDAAVVDLGPRCAAVLALPNSLIDGIVVGVKRNEPDIHFVASGHDRDFGAIDGAG